MAAKITLGIIARDATSTIVKCLESAAPYVDEIIVGFGGQSSDGTEEIVERWLLDWQKDALEFTEPRGRVFRIDWRDDFAWARNELMSKVSGDYFLWLDADDELVNGALLRERIEAAPQSNLFVLPYHYDHDEYGNLSCTLWRERVIRDPHQWNWIGAVHETLNLEPSVPLYPTRVDDVIVRHQPDRNRNKGTRNLDILYRELEKTEPEPSQRLLFYLGRENANRGNLREALMHWNRYIGRTEIDDEAYQVAYMISATLGAQKRYQDASKAALRAIEIGPAWPDAYFLLARLAYEQGRLTEAVEWTKAGATKEPPLTSAIVDPRTYTYWPYYYLGLAYQAMGDFEMALPNLERAAKVIPDHQLLGIIAQVRQELSQRKVLDAFQTLYENLGRNDEWLKVRHLFRAAPKSIEQHPAVRSGWLQTYQATAHVDDPSLMEDLYRRGSDWVPMSEDLLFSDRWATHPRMAFARKSITCAPPATILDLGSADGFISLPLAKDGHIVEGFDLNGAAIEIANQRAQEHGLKARYVNGGLGDVKGKYDVALALEIIEHLPDPKGFLDALEERARKVVLSTPYLAWNRGNRPDWGQPELKEHLRIYDLADMESLLSGRGRIFDLHYAPSDDEGSGWIFASYRPRQEYAGTVTFLAPETIEEWSPPKRLEQGLGGSETALIRLAEELFLEGELLPSIYGRIDRPGYYNGARYRSMDTFEPSVASDVLVSWRWPEAADLPIRAKRLILWMHDVDYRDRLTPVRAARFDQIVVLSQWHRQHVLETYPFIEPDKLIVIGNGVDMALFSSREVTPKREPHRVIYTSSPDRGLDAVLEHVWPKVVELVPEAELHIYYGWRNFEILGQSNPYFSQFKQRVVNLAADTKGVVWHGRLAPAELARELRMASVWLYPSHNFDETYCISAVEAQLSGVVPVTSARGALSETVRSGIVVQGTIGEDGVADAYARAVADVLALGSGKMARLRCKVRAAAPAMEWAEVARQWLEVLG